MTSILRRPFPSTRQDDHRHRRPSLPRILPEGPEEEHQRPEEFPLPQVLRRGQVREAEVLRHRERPHPPDDRERLLQERDSGAVQRPGYAVNCGVLCAADYGVPQDRHRTCIIGKLDADETVALPAPYGRSATIWDAISDLAYLESGEGEEVSKYRNKPQSAYQRMMRDGSTELYNHIATAHSKITLERLRMIPPEHGKEMLPTEHLTKSIYSGTWCPDEEGWHREDDHYAVRHARHPGRVHAPVPEPSDNHSGGARHQSFPDTYHFYGAKSSQMKQVGNAVPPLLGKAIAEQIMHDLKS